jgi:Flp pilus assembly protein TadD
MTTPLFKGKIFVLAIALACTTINMLLTAPDSSAANLPSSLLEDPKLLRAAAFDHYIKGDTESALNFYERAVQKATEQYGPDSSYVGDLYFEMGMLAWDTGKFAKAEHFLTESARLNPNSLTCRLKLAELLKLREKPAAALVQIQSALATHQTSPEARQELSSWLRSQGHIVAAAQQAYVATLLVTGQEAPAQALQISIPVATSSKVSMPSPTPVPTLAPPSIPHTGIVAPKILTRTAIPTTNSATTPPPEKAKPAAAENGPVIVPAKPTVEPAKTKERHIKIRKAPIAKHANKRREELQAQIPQADIVPKTSHKHKGAKPVGKGVLVPPPPPTTPFFGEAPPAPDVQMQSTLHTNAKLKNKVSIKHKTDKTQESVSGSGKQAPSNAGESGDPEFILEWSGVKDKPKTRPLP